VSFWGLLFSFYRFLIWLASVEFVFNESCAVPALIFLLQFYKIFYKLLCAYVKADF